MSQQQDKLFAEPLGDISEFRFDQGVVDVFPDMLQRSIPGYQSIIAQSGLLAAKYARADTTLFDLGCSLGATSLAMRNGLMHTPQIPDNIAISGIDNSPAMLQRCQNIVDSLEDKRVPITLELGDITRTPLNNASVIALNFTLQFIPPEQRMEMMQKAADALVPGGVMILSEKICFDDPRLEKLHTDMYYNFKGLNGYSELEISQKRTALENVLIPDTITQHQTRMKTAGFSTSTVWFQCFNFVSLIALRS
ncbi:MAG: carboxy-S-adenosyl-L-methionine synthase CmoA [Granulosicoccaceae bacterium]